MKTKNNNIDKLKKLIEESLPKGDSPITEATLSKAQLEKREDILKNLKKNKKELVKRYGKDAEAVMYGRATNLAKKAVSEMNKQKLKELVRKSLMNEADIETMADRIGGEEELSLASNLLDDFESKLKSHDWYYMMSDDNRAYTKGSAEESELKKIAKQLADMGYGDDAAKIYDQYNTFKTLTFDKFIAPAEPFIPMYKRKQMGLDEKAGKDMDKDGDVDSDDYLAARDAAIKKAKGEMKEDIDLGHEDNEPHMIKGELYQIGKYAMDLYAILEELEEKGGEYDFPAWWQSKITTAKNMMSGAKHYLDFELKEPAIDAAVDALTGEEPHEGEPMMEDQETLNQVRNELLGLFQPYGEFHIVDMARLKGEKVGEEFRLYAKSKGANWKGLENFMRNNPDFTIHHISKQTFDNPKAIDFSYKKSTMMEDKGDKHVVMKGNKFYTGTEFVDDIKDAMRYNLDSATMVAKREKGMVYTPKKMNENSAEETLAGKIAKALKDKANKDASDQSNLKQARTALNKGNLDAAKKIADPYLEEKKLTKAEKKKKEDIVKGMKGSFKGDESAMYAIATAKAKKVAETLIKNLKND